MALEESRRHDTTRATPRYLPSRGGKESANKTPLKRAFSSAWCTVAWLRQWRERPTGSTRTWTLGRSAVCVP